jgi:hypothetical protein
MLSLSEIPSAKQSRAKYWFKIFEDWKKSNLTKLRYCKTNNINASTFYRWLEYLQVEPNSLCTTSKDQTKFIAVTIAEASPVIKKSIAVNSGLSIFLPQGLSLRIEKDFDPETLLKVVKILEGLC